jgi:FkbM family methyltransferase
MTHTTTLIMVDGVRVVVPDSLDLITPYVLLEQQDWFEDEIKFVRRLLRPGQKVIDIGANYGVYALSMAQTVGPTGCVWAFEPASSTATLLAEGIAVNGFPQVVLEQSALSSTCGTAQLSLNENSELNSLVPGRQYSSASETVPLVTLDECMERYGWRDIAFMKIDAEGEEANILKGGRRFFAELSPLVQYEIKAGADLHMELVQDFATLGYDSYRLVPGLDLLVSFGAESTPDGYLLNLFCCKQDCVERLVTHGFLLASAANRPTTRTARFMDISGKVKNRNAYDWRHTIAKLPYGAQLANSWEQTVAAGNSAEVEGALSLYAVSRDSSLSSTERFGALEASFDLLKILCERQRSCLRLASMARVARDYGARSLAVNALQQLAIAIQKHNRVDPSEPFLVPGERFDSIPPTGVAVGNWVLAAVLEEIERLGSFSSFYTGASARQRLEIIRELGFGSVEMERRLRLLQKRFGLPAA